MEYHFKLGIRLLELEFGGKNQTMLVLSLKGGVRGDNGTCKCCNTGVIEDVKHFVVECP